MVTSLNWSSEASIKGNNYNKKGKFNKERVGKCYFDKMVEDVLEFGEEMKEREVVIHKFFGEVVFSKEADTKICIIIPQLL